MPGWREESCSRPVVVLPDAEPETTTRIISGSAFGWAGQRCLAISVSVTVGEAHEWSRNSIRDVAGSLKVGLAR
jgi:malonate-semialdehyde dehydrogenase (acetylating) / methylmalonate-semialdehyde dehydrogenase